MLLLINYKFNYWIYIFVIVFKYNNSSHLSNSKMSSSNEIIVECPSPNLLRFNKMINEISDIANNTQYKLKIFLEKQ